MSIFKSKKKFTISGEDPTYKVRYLGNVQTALMKGDGCVDKPTAVLWNNYQKSGTTGIGMKLTVCCSGLKAHTKEQGLTEYRAHRISYCIAHPKYPKLFVWVYRHEGKKMKVELRCHAVLCKRDGQAKALAVLLHDKLSFALSEFLREKVRRQTTRLTLQRTNSLPSHGSGISGVPLRNKFLNTGKNFKPPIDRSSSAPKLGDICEDIEPEEISDVEEEEDLDEEANFIVDNVILPNSTDDANEMMMARVGRLMTDTTVGFHTNGDVLSSTAGTKGPRDNAAGKGQLTDRVLTDGVFDLEIGNDVEALKLEGNVQYQMSRNDSDDDDSSESGYSEPDSKESASSGSSGSYTSSGDCLESLTDEQALSLEQHSFSSLPDASDSPEVASTLEEVTLDHHDHQYNINDRIHQTLSTEIGVNGFAVVGGHLY